MVEQVMSVGFRRMGGMSRTVLKQVILFSMLSSLGACSETVTKGELSPGTNVQAKAEKQAKPQPAFRIEDRYYDLKGDLRESENAEFGIKMPLGLKEISRTETSAVFRSFLPIEKFLAFFGPRLLTGRLEKVGRGAIYRGVNTEIEGDARRIDLRVVLFPPSKTEIDIRLLPKAKPSTRKLSPDEVQELFRKYNEEGS